MNRCQHPSLREDGRGDLHDSFWPAGGHPKLEHTIATIETVCLLLQQGSCRTRGILNEIAILKRPIPCLGLGNCGRERRPQQWCGVRHGTHIAPRKGRTGLLPLVYETADTSHVAITNIFCFLHPFWLYGLRLDRCSYSVVFFSPSGHCSDSGPHTLHLFKGLYLQGQKSAAKSGRWC